MLSLKNIKYASYSFIIVARFNKWYLENIHELYDAENGITNVNL